MSLETARQEIDRIDRELLALLQKRYECVSEIGQLKRAARAPVFVPEREAEQLRRLRSLAGPLVRPETLYAIYREIFSGARALEKSLPIACPAGEGPFCQLAVRYRFGSSAECTVSPTLPEVLESVKDGHAAYGCLPMGKADGPLAADAVGALLDSGLSVIAQFPFPEGALIPAERFWIAGRQETRPTGLDVTLAAFCPGDEDTADRIVQCCRSAGIFRALLCKDPCCVLELQGHFRENPVRMFLEHLAGECPFFRVLGSYPC